MGKLKLVVKVIAKIFVIFLVIFQANAKRNFDETVEAHVRLGIKKERTDQVHTLGHLSKTARLFQALSYLCGV